MSVQAEVAAVLANMRKASPSELSTTSWSLEKRLLMRPRGVVSKNKAGARSTRSSAVVCMMRAARVLVCAK